MKSFFKLALKHWKKILLGLVGAVVLLLVIVRMMLPGIIRGRIESIGSKTLGVPVKVDGVGLSLMKGSFSIKGLTVQAPTGFTIPTLLSIKNLQVNVEPASLLGDRIVVDLIEIDGLDLSAEVDAQGRQSLQQLIANAAAKPAADEEAREKSKEEEESNAPTEETPGKSILLENIELTNFRVVSLDAFADSEPITATVSFERFSLENALIAPPALSKAGETAAIALAGLEMSVTGDYDKPQLLKLGELGIEVDLGRFLASGNQQELSFAEIRLVGLEVNTEEPSDRSRSNSKVYQRVMTNGLSAAAPRRIDGSQRDPEVVAATADADAPQPDAPSQPATTEKPDGEKGGLRVLEIAVLDLSDVDARTIRSGTTRFKVSKGAISMKDLVYGDDRVRGEVSFQVKGFDYDVASNREANVFLAPLKLMLGAGVGKSPVVFNVRTKASSLREFLVNLVRGVQAKALPGSEIVTDALGTATDAVGGAVGTASDALGTGADAVGEAAKGVGGAAEKVGGAIGDLFGKNKAKEGDEAEKK